MIGFSVAGCSAGPGKIDTIRSTSSLIAPQTDRLEWIQVHSTDFQLRALSFLNGNFDASTESRFDADAFLASHEKLRLLRRSVFERGGSLVGLGGNPAITVSWGVQVMRMSERNGDVSAEQVFRQIAAMAKRKYRVELTNVRGAPCVVRKGREQTGQSVSELRCIRSRSMLTTSSKLAGTNNGSKGMRMTSD